MATPLADLIGQVINEADARAAFAAAPETFLEDHGYTELDAADVREAVSILADGSPPAEAAGYLAAGEAIDNLDPGLQHGLGGAAAGLGIAVAVIVPEAGLAVDPGELDGIDDVPNADDGDRRDATVDDPAVTDDADDGDESGIRPGLHTVTDSPGHAIDQADLDHPGEPVDADPLGMELPDLVDTVDTGSLDEIEPDQAVIDGWDDII